jgi:uncharacterized repeat protein (TIGR01451 family)
MRGWLRWRPGVQCLQPAIVLALAMVGPFSVQLHAQEFDKIKPLYFTKAYGGTDPLPQIVTVTGGSSAFEFSAAARTSSGGDWLTVSPTENCCTAPGPVTVTVNADSTLEVGSYSGEILLTGNNGRSLVVDVHLVVTPAGAAAFDKTPSQLSFSMNPGESPASQMMQVSGIGEAVLQWRLVAATLNGFLSVSAQTGTGPTRITVGVAPDQLPDAGATAGVYTGQLLFISPRSTVTVPVRVSVGNTASNASRYAPANTPGSRPLVLSQPAAGSNLWPANTSNCLCGGFNNYDSAFGGNALAPDGTASAKLVTEANPGRGAVPHYQYIYTDLGSGQQTLSFHLKADIDSWAYITSTVDGVVHRVYFDLVNGTVGTNIPAGWSVSTPLSLGSGWYRYAVTFTASNSAVYNGLGLATGDQQSDYIATNGHGVYEWGQQAEHGTLSAYQPALAPCVSPTVQRDAGLVSAGSPIGFTVSVFNQASPTVATTLTSALPGGTGINWSINPAYSGPGTCAITGTGSQTLNCDFSNLAPAGLGSLHITSATSGAACGPYTVTANVTVAGTTHLQASDSETIACSTSGLTIVKTHTGNFSLGQQNATYSVLVSNAAGSASTSGTVTVTETIPTGLTLVSMAGSGWTFPGGNTCTRTDPLTAGTSYAAITVTVNVAANAPAQVTNQVSVSGGASAGATASDITSITQVGVPSVVSLSPTSGSATTQTFTFTFADTNGASNLDNVTMLFSETGSGSGACWLFYSRRFNLVDLYNDSATAAVGPAPPGYSTVLQNSQCALNVGSTTIASLGNQLTVVIPVTFQPSFLGTKQIYLIATNLQGVTSGWQIKGSWTLGSSTTPTVVGMNPASGSGLTQIFSFTFADTGGAANIDNVTMLFSATGSGSGACWLFYSRRFNLVDLYNDGATAAVGPAPPGYPTVLQNSQCLLNIGSTTITPNGIQLTVVIPVTFKPAFTGTKTTYLRAVDMNQADTGWRTMGTWTVQ